MAIKEKQESDLAIPPGSTLRQELRARRMTQRDLAEKMERPVQTIKDICLGRKAITGDIASDLEKTLGIKVSTWTNLEAIYRSALARQRRRQANSTADANRQKRVA